MPQRRRLVRWGCGTGLVIVVVLVVLVVVLAIIARDPVGVADRIRYALGEVGSGAKAVLHAPIAFFQSLVTFIQRL